MRKLVVRISLAGAGIAVLLAAGAAWALWTRPEPHEVCCAFPPEPVTPRPPGAAVARTRAGAVVQLTVAFARGDAPDSTPIVRYGNGTILTADGTIATTAALLAPPFGAQTDPRVTVRFDGGSLIRMQHTPRLADPLAMLRIDFPAALRTIPIDRRSLQAGDSGFVVGYGATRAALPGDSAGVFPCLIVRGLDAPAAERRFAIRCGELENYPGAPFLDREGALVGMVLGRLPGPDRLWAIVESSQVVALLPSATPPVE